MIEENEEISLNEIKLKINNAIRVSEKALLEENMLPYYKKGITLGDTQCHYLLAKYYLDRDNITLITKENIIEIFDLLSYCIKKDYNAFECKKDILSLFLQKNKLLKKQTDFVFKLLDEVKNAGQSFYAIFFKDGAEFLSKKQMQYLADKMLKELLEKDCPVETLNLMGKLYLGIAKIGKYVPVDIEKGFETISRAEQKNDKEAYDIVLSLFVSGSGIFLLDKKNTITKDLSSAYVMVEKLNISDYDKLFLVNEISGFGRYKYKGDGLKYLHQVLDAEKSIECISKMNFLRPISLGFDTYSTLSIYFDFQSDKNAYELIKNAGLKLFEDYKQNNSLKDLSASKLLLQAYSLSFDDQVNEQLKEIEECEKKNEKAKLIYDNDDYVLFTSDNQWELTAKISKDKIRQNLSNLSKELLVGYSKAFKKDEIFESARMQLAYFLMFAFHRINASQKDLLKDTISKYSHEFVNVIKAFDNKPKYLDNLLKDSDFEEKALAIVKSTISKLKRHDLDKFFKFIGLFTVSIYKEFDCGVREGYVSVLDFVRENI